MPNLETVVAEIELKVRRLIEENDRLRALEAQLDQQCRQLQTQIDSQHIVINNLKEENKVLKLGNALTQKGDSVEIKLKINQLIRNIDKSLALINKTE